uniref:Integrase catalytic domain-containing protein n=1 Tax=Cannabis sativa TaxID=3483 RepID=A0A803QD60_CANSA
MGSDPNSNTQQKNNHSAFVAAPELLESETWFADSGASNHITSDSASMTQKQEYGGKEKVTVGNGTQLSISHLSNGILYTDSGQQLVLKEMLLVPEIAKNLLSVSKLTHDNNVLMEFYSDCCVVKDKLTKKVLLQGMLRDGLYQLQAPQFKTTTQSTSQIESNKVKSHSFSGVVVKSKSSRNQSKILESLVSKSDVWDRRLGHPSPRVLSQVLNSCQVKISKNEMLHFCDACQFGKSHALPFKNSNSKATNVLDLVHSDLWGPSPVMSNNGFRIYIHFIDDCTRYTWIYPLKTKAEASEAFLQFKVFAETQLERKIKRLRTDLGGEYQALQNIVIENGIDFHHSCPHTSAQNGRAKRKHRHVVEMGLTLLAQAHMPLKYWWETFQTAVYLINRLPTPILENKSPFETLYIKEPDYAFLKVFGFACFPCIRPYQAHKFQFHSLKYVNLGYSESHKGYRCLTPTGKIYISRNVVFNELEFPFKLGFLNNYQQEKPVIIHSSSWSVLPSFTLPTGTSTTALTPSLGTPEESPSTPTHSQVRYQDPAPFDLSPASVSGPSVSGNERGNAADIAEPDSFHLHSGEMHTTSDSPIPAPPPTGDHMVTRAKEGIFKPRVFMGQTAWKLVTKVPCSVEEALSHPGWNKAMQLTGNNNNRLKSSITELNKKFALKDLSSLHYFLGLEAYRDDTRLYLTQTKYIEDLLQRTNFTNIKPCPTPATAGKPMSLSDADQPLHITGYSDADWACCPDDRKSIAGYCVYFGNTLVLWSSKKQPVVARSSTESEYRALAHVAAEISWIESLLKELGLQTPTAVTWCDNMGANALASNPVFHARNKHIEIDIHFIRDKVLNKELDIRYIPSSDQVADCLTKRLSSSRFHFLIDKLGVMNSPLHLRGDVKK